MRSAACFAAAVVAAFSSGCGSNLTLVPVSGVVTLDGSPLEGATVLFSPNTPNPDGETSFGISGPDGRYDVMTRESRGAVPGKYRVSVSKTLLDLSSIPDEFKDDPSMYEQFIPPEVKGKRRPPNVPPPLVKIEGAFAQEVPPEGGTIDLDVKSKAPAKATRTAKKSP